MQNHELKIIRQIINERLELIAIEEQSNRKASDTVKLDQQSVGRLSRIDALQQQAMAKAIDERRKNERKALKQALYRLNQGTYGECIDCGESIKLNRLISKPSVLKCFDCMKI